MKNKILKRVIGHLPKLGLTTFVELLIEARGL